MANGCPLSSGRLHVAHYKDRIISLVKEQGWLLKIFESVSKHMDRGNLLDIAYLDF